MAAVPRVPYGADDASHSTTFRSRPSVARHSAWERSRADLRRGSGLRILSRLLAHAAPQNRDCDPCVRPDDQSRAHARHAELRARACQRTMQSVGRIFVQYFNTKYGGPEHDGKDATRRRSSMTSVLADLHALYRAQPVRAGIVANPADYHLVQLPIKCLRGNRRGDRGTSEFPRPWMCATRTARRVSRAVSEVVSDEDMRSIRRATQNGWAMGGDEFRRRVSVQCRRASPVRVRAARNEDQTLGRARSTRSCRAAVRSPSHYTARCAAPAHILRGRIIFTTRHGSTWWGRP